MKCINVKENLDALLDGEIELSRQREIENHLENCQSCRAEFENLQAISGILKRNAVISAPKILDEKVFSEFENFHKANQAKKKPQKERIGWFRVPRFAFATAFLLFVLGIFSAFQIGKMSASEISVVMPEVRENKNSDISPNVNFTENKLPDTGNYPPTKIIEVPVIREKIVEVPVIKEKIVTRTIYLDRKQTEEKEKVIRPNFNKNDDVALGSLINDNGFVTQTNLKGFQPVSQLKVKITKKEKE